MNISHKFNLPDVVKVAPRCEPDFYGASNIIASALEIPREPPISDASWLHGWRFNEIKYDGELILRFNRHCNVHLVANEHQGNFLKSCGHDNVEVVGTPFVYAVDKSDICNSDKIANSLLVMPAHSTKEIDVLPEEEKYIQFLLDSVDDGTFICFCIHQHCEEKGLWVNSLKKFGIPYVIGASLEDRNGLLRMKKILMKFERMTTNSFGSHILQASLLGLRVSVNGEYSLPKFDGVIKANRWNYLKEDILAYKNMVKGYSLSEVKRLYPQFFVDINQATQNIEWAIGESGFDKKRSYLELSKLLGWDNALANLLDYHTFRYWRSFKKELLYVLNVRILDRFKELY